MVAELKHLDVSFVLGGRTGFGAELVSGCSGDGFGGRTASEAGGPSTGAGSEWLWNTGAGNPESTERVDS